MRITHTLAVHLLLVRGGRLLVIRRAGTGWMDGSWSVPAGHVEAGESAALAAQREALEEVGVAVELDALKLVHAMHRSSDAPRVDLFFEADVWRGEAYNCEPDKCDGMEWVEPDALPAPMVPYVAQAVARWRAGEVYSEHGWERG